jgi:hypothetical protein
MANTQQTLKKIRNRVKSITGIETEDHFYTFDRDTQKIVSNREIGGWHFIFDLDGNEIESKRHKH